MIAKLELYRIFVAVAQESTLSQAAKKLFISQSAVSQAIAQLERTLALPLLNRSSKGVSLTAEGRLLFDYAKAALELLESGEQKLEALKALSYGNLNIGASDTLCSYLLLNPLDRFHKAHPKVRLQLVNRTSLELIAMLKTGKLDLAFVNLPIADDDLEIMPHMQVRDTFVMAPDFLESTHLTIAQLSQVPLIMLESKSNSRRYVERFFKQNGLSIEPEIELGSYELLLQLAGIGLGVSAVIAEFAQTALSNGQVVELTISPPIPPRHIGIACLKGVQKTGAAQAFIAQLCTNKY